MNYGIIFEGDSSPMESEVADRLRELGFYAYGGDGMSDKLLEAVNTYRRSLSLRELDFCDPTVLRAMGIEATGDEIITLAKCALSAAENEVECYDICREAVFQSKELGITLTEAALRHQGSADTEQLPPFAVQAAILALLDK